VVQIAWASDWEITGGLGLKSASCRPSTLFKYIFDSVHKDSLTTGFCAQGISGGGATIAYSLAHYGLSNYFDYVVIGAGPGVARMDYGCDKPLYTGAPRNLCSLLSNAPYAYPAGTKENNWEDTTTCAAKSPLPNDISRWTADSIVTTGATYSYPKTGVSFYFCVTPPAAQSAGQGSFFTTQVIPKNNPADVNCYSGVCKGESVWQDKSAFNTTVAEMLAQCVPNHKKSSH
jgi:hypothetical protein